MIIASPKILFHWRNSLTSALTRERWVITSVFREAATHHSSGAGVDALPLSAVSEALRTSTLPRRREVIAASEKLATRVPHTSFIVEDHHVHFFYSGSARPQFITWR